MPKAARKKSASPIRRKAKAKPQYFWWAILQTQPTASLINQVQWVKSLFAPPSFKVITIQNGKVDQLEVGVSRGTRKTAPDMVCWVNKDGVAHEIQFLAGLWPFDPALNPPNNDEKITVPAMGATAWFRVWPEAGALGFKVSYDYGIDVGPGPPGPTIITED